ncbi:MAG: hypothetical protein IPJ85_01585 [Flavobacteriales bacterium]|nr:hypothetical protein [Flavobacteriales bacterium]
MSRWMAHVMIALALLALGYAQVGYFLRYEAQRISIQRGIKDRIRKGLPPEKLTPFSMSKQEWEALHWVKPGREFRLDDGRMFDVVTVSELDGHVEATCVADHEETELFAGLREHVRRNMEGHDARNGPSAQVNRLIMALCMPPAPLDAVEPAVVRVVVLGCLECSARDGHSLGWAPPPDRMS